MLTPDLTLRWAAPLILPPDPPPELTDLPPFRVMGLCQIYGVMYSVILGKYEMGSTFFE